MAAASLHNIYARTRSAGRASYLPLANRESVDTLLPCLLRPCRISGDNHEALPIASMKTNHPGITILPKPILGLSRIYNVW